MTTALDRYEREILEILPRFAKRGYSGHDQDLLSDAYYETCGLFCGTEAQHEIWLIKCFVEHQAYIAATPPSRGQFCGVGPITFVDWVRTAAIDRITGR